MSEPTLIQSKTSLPVDQIEVSGRLRPVSEAGIATLRASIAEIGQITSPIAVRQLRRNGETIYRIIDGAHRHATAVELGWTEVPVRVFECTDDQARIMEIDGNLAGAELNPLDNAVFLATRKVVYERLHPETKAGVAGALAKHGSANDMMSFAETTAEKFGLSRRQVERLVAAGSRLGPDEIAELRRAPRQVTLKDLQVIAKIKKAPDRYLVVKALAAGEARNASDALKAINGAVEAAPKSPVDEQYLALQRAWKRAGAAARRRFVQECSADLTDMLNAAADRMGVAAE
ncbi:chromosome partitioning protein ParB [Paracoccus kondratievae]|uniref:ParB/RepB/Spo0J family partition protein n=1 Tax=Paracoccus kondratievae TaxID=135740 RepID=UPI0012661F2A|nr:ParB N-terminal domain-containing protein [Paracoccus kondratievae]QFQ88238.1 chromosome partitioning protein ParB [Paracoccus kondratievae]